MKGSLSSDGSESDTVQFDLEIVVGNTSECNYALKSSEDKSFKYRIRWDKRSGGWFLRSEADPVQVKIGEKVYHGDGEIPIFLPASIWFGETRLLLTAIPDAPRFGGKAVSSGYFPLTLVDRVDIGRGDREVEEGVRMALDPELLSGVSSRHAVLKKNNGSWSLSNVSEKLSVIVNNQAISEERLVYGDRIEIGPYLFGYYFHYLLRLDDRPAGSVQARGLKKIVAINDERTGKKVPLAIVTNVSLDIPSGTFVAIIGGSGEGKSTLMNALCGVSPATNGKVWIGDVEMKDRSSIMAAGIGFVPQDDIVHRELKVRDALILSAKLRLKLPERELRLLVAKTLEKLALLPHQSKPICKLSGGQRKRVSIAVELLSSPSVLFLDEPTSGLDPFTEWELMTTLQYFSGVGVTVVCTTHMLENAHICDRFLIVQSGRVIFDGRPSDARTHFLGKRNARSFQSTTGFSGSVNQSATRLAPFSRIFRTLKQSEKSGEEWEADFKSSPYCREFGPTPGGIRSKSGPKGQQKRQGAGLWRTMALLCLRQWMILSSEKLNLVFLLAQALLIGVLIGWVAEDLVLRGFLSILATMWFGCSNGAQQIVRELPIFRRERVSGQGINAYILSKFLFLSCLTMLQAAILFLTTYFSTAVFHGREPGTLFQFAKLEQGKGEQMGELIAERLFPIPEEGMELADRITMDLLLTPSSESDQGSEKPPEEADVVEAGLVKSVVTPGLFLAVENPEDWKPGSTVSFMNGERLQLPLTIPEYPASGFRGLEVRPGMVRSPFVEEGGWRVFRPRERESQWKPGATVVCAVTQQRFQLPESLPPWPTETVRYRVTYFMARYFGLEDVILDANNVIEDSSRVQPAGKSATGTLPIFKVMVVPVAMEAFSLFLIAVVGVSIGLSVSALVQNETQAVLWVPLVLIPQILFGGFVVKVPEMSVSVRFASFVFPSFAAQRVMDVAHIYGRIVPKVSNKTKLPVFTEGGGEKVEWVERDPANGSEETKSEKFQNEVPENSSWQNLLVVPSRLGQHEIKGDFLQVFRQDGSFQTSVRQEPDTVDERRDMQSLYYHGIRFVRLRDAQIAMVVLCCWIVLCYGTTLISLTRKQTG